MIFNFLFIEDGRDSAGGRGAGLPAILKLNKANINIAIAIAIARTRTEDAAAAQIPIQIHTYEVDYSQKGVASLNWNDKSSAPSTSPEGGRRNCTLHGARSVPGRPS